MVSTAIEDDIYALCLKSIKV